MRDKQSIQHRWADIDGIRTFYRECGPADAPVLLLPHGYPCSSYQYRRLMPAVSDQWRTLAPDYPGFGYTETPEEFQYDFDGYGRFLIRFVETLGISRYVIYLHDYGTWIGLRLAMSRPDAIAGLIIQNGDLYEDALGPKYGTLRKFWTNPSEETRKPLVDAINEEGFRHEFVGEVEPEIAETVPPDLWKLHWPLMDTPKRRSIALGLMERWKANADLFPKFQTYLREHKPPTLMVWGPEDGYMPATSAQAYLRDLPDAELHLLDGAGHWLLETHFEQALSLIEVFLGRVRAEGKT
ncbi:alpha/beta fold hydrolase [Pseudoxanthomonas sp. UTMC 1351]|uniref:alpha/beta fold hydrolase n=1 Tax=Pseudoxanthomonas sp. UTMC 1351 TaxID=2695853 RepID=UPI0034CE3848